MKMRSYRTKIESTQILKELSDRLNKYEKKHKEREEKKKSVEKGEL